MKVRMRTLCAGPAGVWHAGRVYDVTPREAADLVAGGYADALERPPALPRPAGSQTGSGPRGGSRAAAESVPPAGGAGGGETDAGEAAAGKKKGRGKGKKSEA